MSDKPTKLVAVIAQLNRMTQEKLIKWKREDPPAQLSSGGDVIYNFYVAEHEGHILGIYEKKYKPNTLYEAALSGSPFHQTTDKEVVLAFFSRIDNKDSTQRLEKEWEFPQVTGLGSLFQSVVFQIADVGSFIDKILENNYSASA